MTPEVARSVLLIMAGADSGCPSCVGRLFARFVRKWPAHRGLALEILRTELELTADEAESRLNER